MGHLSWPSFTGGDGLFQTLWVEVAAGSRSVQFAPVYTVILGGGDSWRHNCGLFPPSSAWMCQWCASVKLVLTCLGPDERPP